MQFAFKVCSVHSTVFSVQSAVYLHQVSANIEAELLDIGVVVEVGLPDEVVDLPLPVRGAPGGGLDHGGGLHVRQLLDAALSLDYVADLQGQVRVLVLLAHLGEGKGEGRW